jgi:hypothetical protein
MVFLSSSSQMLGHYFKLGYDNFYIIPNTLFIKHPNIWYYIVWATDDSIIK